jgi:hypothetical protein
VAVAVLPEDFSSNVAVLGDSFRSAGSSNLCVGDCVGRRGTCSTTYLNSNMLSLEKQSKNIFFVRSVK